MSNSIEFIHPQWPAPDNIHAVSTTRMGGASKAPWAAFNLADHVGDGIENVNSNRQRLIDAAQLPGEPQWLTQVHGCHIANGVATHEADGRYSRLPREVCAVLTADCLPVLLCDAKGAAVAAVHAGWRGLAAGVLEAAVAEFEAPPEQLLAWMGPAIGAQTFKVGAEVRATSIDHDARAEKAFRQIDEQHWLADIYALAEQRLQAVGVNSIYGGGYCTVSDQQRFFSYRRDGVTGRMASLIWIQEK